MQPQCPTARFSVRRNLRRGFSLVEVMVVLAVLGILVAMAVPSYQRTLEQARANIAAANLRAIWSAERLYWLEYHAFTTDLASLRTLGLLDPGIVGATNGFTYGVTSAGNDNFQAVATRTGSTCWTGEYTIDETGLIGGALHAAGKPDIVAGFQ
jgi:prepilin-type N-terminal cleavage/methylation domain-containing protein